MCFEEMPTTPVSFKCIRDVRSTLDHDQHNYECAVNYNGFVQALNGTINVDGSNQLNISLDSFDVTCTSAEPEVNKSCSLKENGTPYPVTNALMHTDNTGTNHLSLEAAGKHIEILWNTNPFARSM